MSVIPTVQPTVLATVDPTAAPAVGQAYGPNIVTNGTFDSNTTGWTAGTGWAWDASSGGIALYNANPGGLEPALSQNLTTVASTVYRLKIRTAVLAGSIRVDVGGATVIPEVGASGTFSGTFTGTGSDLLEIIVPGTGPKIVAADDVIVQALL